MYSSLLSLGMSFACFHVHMHAIEIIYCLFRCTTWQVFFLLYAVVFLSNAIYSRLFLNYFILEFVALTI